MPGIAGLISDREEPLLFDAMQRSMNHMDYAIHRYVHQGLHISALSIHTSSSDGPVVHTQTGRYSLVFYGEIYAVANSNLQPDPDRYAAFFLEQIERNGLDVVSKINGQFSACLHDHTEGFTYLISDRFSTHPVYYTINNNRLLFAAEVKALLCDNVNRKINYHSIGELFSFGHLFGNKTLFENIHLLPPATVLKFKNGKAEQSTYWRYSYSEETYRLQKRDKKKSDELADILGQTLITATRQQAAHADDILLPLSGGLDSRYVAALYHHVGIRKLTTFTMGPDDSEDQRYGSRVAGMLGFPHHRFEIKPEKTWEAASTFSYASDAMSFISGPLQNFEPLSHFTGSKKIVAASQMCDALYGSTLWRKRIRIFQANKESRSKTNEILINLFNLYDQRQVKQLFHADQFARIDGLYRLEPERYCRHEYHPLHNYYELLMNEHGRRGTFGGNVASGLFYQMRMLSYDHNVFDFGWNLPVAYREHQYLYRKTFCRLFPELANVNRQGYGLPISASNRRYELKVLENKIATLAMKSPARHILKYYKPWNRPSYVNHKEWFKAQLREELTSFFSKDLACAEFINTTYARELLKKHMEGKQNNAPLLWQVVNLEHFFRNFMK